VDVPCRPAGEREFTAKTPRFTVELYGERGAGLGITAAGNICVTPDVRPDERKNPTVPHWLYRFELGRAREGDIPRVKGGVIGVETYRERNFGRTLYVSQTGHLAFAPGKVEKTVAAPAPAKPLHRADVAIGKGQVWRVAAFHDANSGNVIYASDTGGLAVVPGAQEPPAGRGLQRWYQLDLKCRKGRARSEGAGKPELIALRVAVYRDDSAGAWIYVSETGALAAARTAAKARTPPKEPLPPRPSHGFQLIARPYSEVEPFGSYRHVGVECYRDANTGCAVYITETGALAVQ
jgi:hypothetical protein